VNLGESPYAFGGVSDIGYAREVNEDYINVVELSEDVLFSIVADGMGSLPGALQPAAIAVNEITQFVKRTYETDSNMFLDNPSIFLSLAIHTANRVLGGFKHGNEELYSGFGACLTCCLLYENTKMCYVHAGNTRLYLIRSARDGAPNIFQLTADHTKAQALVDNGTITLEQYHVHPDRLTYTSGVGVVAEPLIQVYEGSLRHKDILLLTTDGIHYAVRPQAIADIVMASDNCDIAASGLVQAGKMLKYIDNMSAVVIFVRP